MEEGDVFTTWEGLKITVVTSTPNVRLGFGLRNYRKHFLTKAVSFIIWALSGRPEKIEGANDLVGARFNEIMAEINPLYLQTYGKPIHSSTLSHALTHAISQKWIRRITSTKLPHSRYTYFPSPTILKRYKGWRNYYWKGLEPQFAPTSFKE